MLDKCYSQASLLALLVALLASSALHASELLLPNHTTILQPDILSGTDRLISYLIAAFGFAVISYHMTLYCFTRQNVYLQYSAAFFGYIIGQGEYIGLWHLPVSSQASAILIIDIVNMILFIAFIKQFLQLFINFKQAHPILDKVTDIYCLVGVALILTHIVYPDTLFYTVSRLLIIVASLTAICTTHCWYPSLKHLRTFVGTIMLLSLLAIYHYTHMILVDDQGIAFMSHLGFACGALVFLSFASMMNKQIFQDSYKELTEEQKKQADQNHSHLSNLV
jgi:hypothetical protein